MRSTVGGSMGPAAARRLFFALNDQEPLYPPAMSIILLVEDDSDLRDIWTEVLEIKGHDVRAARSVAEAQTLDVADVDLVVVDWTLPDGSGEEVAQSIRDRGCHATLVITTGYGADSVPAGSAGAAMILRKPFRIRELTAVVAELTSPRG